MGPTATGLQRCNPGLEIDFISEENRPPRHRRPGEVRNAEAGSSDESPWGVPPNDGVLDRSEIPKIRP
jgi:hypothetical protein